LTNPPSPPPGWYPDPKGTGGRAYWDGSDWGSPPPTRKPPSQAKVVLSVAGVGVAVILLVAVANAIFGENDDNNASPTDRHHWLGGTAGIQR
jgi:hypothetical protein